MNSFIETSIPQRLDRLPWSRFHWLVIAALGITWILDGVEVTLVGSIAGALRDSRSLGLSNTEIGLAASAYLTGAIAGALGFGYLTDRFGRKRLFSVTVGVYMVATILSGLSWNFWSFAAFRLLTGAGIGGEYSAINSAIQELIPARRRGWTDLAVNGSFWIGAALGAIGSLVALDPSVVTPTLGWRLAFVVGGLLAAIALYLRRYIPESPRWLMTHARIDEAEAIVDEIEAHVRRTKGGIELPVPEGSIRIGTRVESGIVAVVRILAGRYAKRSILGFVLMAAQAFCYNAIFFTYALVLTQFYGIPAARVGWYILPFACGNFLGPLLLGNLFDRVGRRAMIAASYGIAGLLMAGTGWLFAAGLLDATSQTAVWTVIFFFASAAASAAYLTVSESFPLEIRALTIALFYASGTALGGIAGPALFGALIDSGSRQQVFWGYLLAAGLMVFAAALELRIGIAAERRSLEAVARPLSMVD